MRAGREVLEPCVSGVRASQFILASKIGLGNFYVGHGHFRCAVADIRSGGDRAFYSPQLDFISLPPENAFNGAQNGPLRLCMNSVTGQDTPVD